MMLDFVLKLNYDVGTRCSCLEEVGKGELFFRRSMGFLLDFWSKLGNFRHSILFSRVSEKKN